ncbi:hypothetical protein [Vibrio europaeus]|uniref:hypothetical protein n=1 Tax=Vibrio europaeus TaxID=300876 RepID=UPI00233EC9BF|nr:hypothetical protein [Vibrio europaeus]MDC5719421.1 hypothetical protein [Vibrio europaeus]MDC5720983.1 hypothetical protein [Vibrio europaeus]
MELGKIAFKVAHFMFGFLKKWYAKTELSQDQFFRVDIANIAKINHGEQLRITLDCTNLGYMTLNVFSIKPATILVNNEAYLGELQTVSCNIAPQERKQLHIHFNLPQREQSKSEVNVRIEMLEINALKGGHERKIQRMDPIHYNRGRFIPLIN